jgi:hypothetical protein
MIISMAIKSIIIIIIPNQIIMIRYNTDMTSLEIFKRKRGIPVEQERWTN